MRSTFLQIQPNVRIKAMLASQQLNNSQMYNNKIKK